MNIEGEGARPAPVLSLGEALIDLIATDQASTLEDAQSFVARNGGAPANVAVALARLGVPSAFCGVVGDDPFGRRLASGLASEHVDTRRLHHRSAATTIAFAWKDFRGDGKFWLLRGADTTLHKEDVEAADIPALAAMVVGSVALAAEPSRSAVTHAVELAAQTAAPVCFDVNLRPTLWDDLDSAREACQPILAHSTVLKLSLDDARGLLDELEDPRQIVDAVRDAADIPFIVITDGERGCWYVQRDDSLQFVPAFSVTAVEPTGAGDAFTAALISRLLDRNWSSLARADIEYAAAAGALATLRPGAWDGLPTADDLHQFLAQAPQRIG